MGKVKRLRQKYHASVKAKNKDKDDDGNNMETEGLQPEKSESTLPTKDIFGNIQIDFDSLKKRLTNDDDDNFDAKSTITSKSFKGLNVKKKDKRKVRQEIWMKKMDTIQTTKKEAKEKKRRLKTAVVGDMKPLEDTLPTLELLLKESFQGESQKKEKNESKPKPIKRKKQRQKEMTDNIALFQQVLQHPAYQKNPGNTIKEHLENKLKQEAMDL